MNLKSKVIVINNKIVKLLLLVTIIFIIISIYNLIKNKKVDENHLNFIEDCSTISEEYNKEEININNIKKEYKKKEIDFPKEIDGIEVIGKLEIPKINLTTYILAETSKENLNKSVTKLCGPKVNGVGNLCITGHNYHNDKMFGDLKKLENGDEIYITDMKGNTIQYIVQDMYKIYPKETQCLSQETNGERQITLITCTTGAIKRLIVKAVEFYD
jgi:sortase A